MSGHHADLLATFHGLVIATWKVGCRHHVELPAHAVCAVLMEKGDRLGDALLDCFKIPQDQIEMQYRMCEQHGYPTVFIMPLTLDIALKMLERVADQGRPAMPPMPADVAPVLVLSENQAGLYGVPEDQDGVPEDGEVVDDDYQRHLQKVLQQHQEEFGQKIAAAENDPARRAAPGTLTTLLIDLSNLGAIDFGIRNNLLTNEVVYDTIQRYTAQGKVPVFLTILSHEDLVKLSKRSGFPGSSSIQRSREILRSLVVISQERHFMILADDNGMIPPGSASLN